MSAMRVDLFGTQCNNDVVDGNGVQWNVASPLPGWASPSFISDRGRITGAPGSALLEEQYGERVLRVTGWVKAPSDAAAWGAYAQLSVMPGMGATGTVTVYEPVPKSLTVRQGEEPDATEPLDGQFDFALTLVALSPYKRGLTERSVTIAPGATVNVVNDGNAPAALTITGSGLVRVKQTVSGQVLRSKVSVASGTVFDGVAKFARSAGGVRLVGVIDNPSEWLSVPRSSSTPVKNEGSAPVVVTWFDTYA